MYEEYGRSRLRNEEQVSDDVKDEGQVSDGE